MKKITLFIVLIALTGCDVNTDDAKRGDDLISLTKAEATCLDGIQYWTKSHQLAVRIDPDTLAPKKCIQER